MTPFSVLDLIPVREGSDVSGALLEAGKLAQTAEEQGYKRFWVAEHHATEGIAGGATAVALSHIGHVTSTIRIGSGGIMLPNHNPFVIAEQFGTLEALFPGRVDLGLGRAPGAGGRIAQALRKDLMRSAESFPQDVVELRALLTGDIDLPIKATPGLGSNVEMWMLGSSLFGAQLAARLGLPYAFASHFAPAHLDEALKTYRQEFRPSAQLDKPHAMAAMTVITAESDAEAQLLASSGDQSFVRLRSGDPGKLPLPVPGYRDSLPGPAQAMLAGMDVARAVGSPATVRKHIGAFLDRTQADELILSGATFDPAARRHSLSLTMEAMRAEV
ncbi:LLM class flavin-dependent oxidoreductase [Altericroceibacterium endophyticum]|uniref:Luciferase-like monooxygenase n=1 Tax=Altericroceibacterium endophyticum TaxID=1808508 RepID=A0A6I4T530_9SPHN|nr:LLM class flavin-dependent oxidoreductase [Altericroceibacterium endophyticum]MXO65788.1 MsnO8 family LLM class oxidoreductase [Altericroceibacterium endophyticum]